MVLSSNTLKVMRAAISIEEWQLLRRLRLAAELRARQIGSTATNYLVGIVKGRFPPFERCELKAPRKGALVVPIYLPECW